MISKCSGEEPYGLVLRIMAFYIPMVNLKYHTLHSMNVILHGTKTTKFDLSIFCEPYCNGYFICKYIHARSVEAVAGDGVGMTTLDVVPPKNTVLN